MECRSIRSCKTGTWIQRTMSCDGRRLVTGTRQEQNSGRIFPMRFLNKWTGKPCGVFRGRSSVISRTDSPRRKFVRDRCYLTPIAQCPMVFDCLAGRELSIPPRVGWRSYSADFLLVRASASDRKQTVTDPIRQTLERPVSGKADTTPRRKVRVRTHR